MRTGRHEKYLDTQQLLAAALEQLAALRPGAAPAERIALEAVTAAAANALGMVERTVQVGLATDDPPRLRLVC